jgi:hypothetical protein
MLGTAAGAGGAGACPPPEGGITFPAAPPPAVVPNGVVAMPAGLGVVLPRVETTILSAGYFFRCFGVAAAFRAVRFSLQWRAANRAALSWLCCELAGAVALSALAVRPVGRVSGTGALTVSWSVQLEAWGVGVVSVLMVIT